MLRDSCLLLFLQYSCFLLCITYGIKAHDVTWYIGDGANSSSDVSVCGRTPLLPCVSLSVVLSNSDLFEINGTACFRSTISDNRTSTTVVFLGGTHVVPTICLFNWTNVIARGDGDVTIYSENFGDYGLFSFANSSNITITNLNFVVNISLSLRAALLFYNSSDITVVNCSFSSEAARSEGIHIENPFGDCLIQGCSFKGNVVKEIPEGSLGIHIFYGEGLSTVRIRDCNFSDFFISQSTNEGNLKNSRSIGQGLRLWFKDYTFGHFVEVSGCRFTDNFAYSGSTFLILFDTGTQLNNVVIDRCKFLGNRNLYGGGIAGYYWADSSNNSIRVNNSIFRDNIADLEGGGLFAAFVTEHVSNVLVIGSCVFENNAANEGAAIQLFNSPGWFLSSIEVRDELVNVKIQNCSFMNNTAYGSSVLSSAYASEGVINALRIRLFLGETNLFNNSIGSAVLLRASLAIISDFIMFQNNRANQGAALKIVDGSSVDATEVIEAHFIKNVADYSGGAIYVDEESSSLSANEYSHLFAQKMPGNCFMLFGNENSPTSNNTRFYFEHNSAGGQGQTMDIFTLRQCKVANFLPASVARLAPVQMEDNFTVVHNTEDDHQSTVTGPNYLFFYGASTKCYKQVADTVYLLPNCSRDLLNETFRNHPDLQCGYEEILSELKLKAGFGLVLNPTVDKLLAPWASLDGSWEQPPGPARLRKCEEVNPGNLMLSPAPGEQFDLTIQVADQILNYISTNLYVQVAGDVEGDTPGVLLQLNGIQYPYTGRVYFTPNRALRGLTLVGLPGTAGELIVVTDSQITGQELVLSIPFKLSNCPVGYCPPRVFSRAEVNILLQENYSFTQRIPIPDFLSCDCIADGSCGYRNLDYDTASRVDCILGYTIQFGGIYWAGMVPPTSGERNTLTSLSSPCNTTQPTNPFTSNITQWVAWTLAHNSNRTRQFSSPELLVSEMGEAVAGNPIDVAPYLGFIVPGGGADVMCFNGYDISYLIEFEDKGEFFYDLCVGGFCKAGVRDDWILTNVSYPCNDNREGIFCGQCKSGYAVKPLTWSCSDCSGANPAWVILLTLIFGLLLVVMVVLLNLGASAPLDSLLFFLQATLILLNTRADYENVQYLSVFTLDYSFNLCLTSDFDGFDRIFFKFATPFYVLLLLSTIILLSSVKPFSKYFGRHSYLQGIWLIILISYVDIAEATLELLHCRSIGVQNKRLALYDDSNVPCYEGKHLPAAIFAIIFSALVIAPFPIYVLLLTRWSKVKPITDVYTSVYKDKKRWWVGIDLGRRLAIVLLAVFNADFIYRHLAITILAGVLVIIDGITWPYPELMDNYVEFSCTSAFFLLCIITYPVLNRTLDPHFIISWCIIAVAMFCATCRLVYLHRSKASTLVEKTCGHRLRNKYFDSVKFMVTSWMSTSQNEKNASINSLELVESIPTAPRYDQFREPLLEDSFVQVTAIVRNSNSSNNNSNATSSSFRVPLTN